MRNKTQGVSYRWRKRLGGWIIVGLSGYLIVVLGRGLWEVTRAGERVKQAEKMTQELQLEQVKLQEQLVVVESEAFREQQIRDQLMLAKPGETVVVIPQEEKVAEVEQEEKVAQENDLPNWQKWARVFGFYE